MNWKLGLRNALMMVVAWLLGLTSWWDSAYLARLEIDPRAHQFDPAEAERHIARPPYPPGTP